MKNILTILFFVLTVNVLNLYAVDKIYLNDNWQFRKVGDTVWYPATVPGTVHTDLYNNGLIPDPFYRDNEKDLQWIENEDWEYKCEFDISDSIYNQTNIDLTFEGLDTYAKVYLNDSLIITADNMFRKWEAEFKRLIRKDKNTLYILFESPVRKAKESKSGVELPGGDRVYTRKAAYHYGWDWGPRYVTSGIWKSVYIEGWDGFKIYSVHFNVNVQEQHSAEIKLNIDFLFSPPNGIYYFQIVNAQSGTIIKQDTINTSIDGLSNLYVYVTDIEHVITNKKIVFNLENPILWWCNGMGEPYLYDFKILLYKDVKLLDERNIKIGVRKIKLVQEKDSIGESFYFKLNGVPLFIKGANYIPQDNLLPRVTEDKYKKIVNDAVSSNINMLRVWGGGIYEDEEFYDLCDEKGILVWQDFMFANAMYPYWNTRSFHKNIDAETYEISKSLLNHPCICLFCGNNEIDEGWHNWGWQKEFGYSKQEEVDIWNHDYLLLFVGSLQTNVKTGLGMNYIPTSPKFGWGHPKAMKEGDSHYWGVWWGMEPFEMYEKKIPRFMSEYGFQGFPNMKTIEQFTLPEDRYLYSPIMKAHQKHPTGYETIQTYMEREYKQPKDFESYLYVSQLLQAYGIKRAIEAHRRAKPYCMGTMYWQLDDCWPGITWSGIDYYGRWKAMQYFVKEAYKDILVSVKEENDSVKVYVVSDRLKETKGILFIGLYDFEGNLIYNKENTVSLGENSSNIYIKVSKADLVNHHSLNNIVLFVLYADIEGKEYSNLYYFVPPKDLALEDPQISYDVDKKTGELILKCEKLAKNVHIVIDDDSAPLNLENNYFDMLPGETVKVNSGEKDIDKTKIKVMSLIDSY
jgi:beta-mannosidase